MSRSATLYRFGPFELDVRARRLRKDGAQVRIGGRHVAVLIHLVAEAGTVVSKDALTSGAWGDLAVTDNSVEQVIGALRKILCENEDGQPYLETVVRHGYRFVGRVTRSVARETDAALDALLAPHRAWTEGRALLETLERAQIAQARAVFERALAMGAADQAAPHIGLANACAMQFEMTRTDLAPDVAALHVAVEHAREACRLEPASAEAWATLGFVFDRTGQRVDALAASRRAVMIEPDNWRHYFRLGLVSWGEERLRAAKRTLTLLPGFPLAHWLAATVYVARQAMDEAVRELDAALAAETPEQRFSSVALHWLHGLIQLAGGDEAGALAAFERELAHEASGHLYARECAANAWYAIGLVRHRQGRVADAIAALEQATVRSAAHPFAHLAVAAFASSERPVTLRPIAGRADAFLAEAARLVLIGHHEAAAALVDQGLVGAPPGNTGWLLPIEPLLAVGSRPGMWAGALARLRTRSA